MRKLTFLLFVLFVAGSAFAQTITPTSLNGLTWGCSKTQLKNIQECNPSYINPDINNCNTKGDSLFLGKFPSKFHNYRFYLDKLFEVNYDFDADKLPFIVAELNKQLGEAKITSKENNPNVKSSSYILYEWTKGDTHLLLLKKENEIPGWLNISSISAKKELPTTGEISIESILFEQ